MNDTLSFVKRELLDIFHEHAEIEGLDVSGNDISDIVFTSATELEFWVKTPLEEAAIKEMSASQVCKSNIGSGRTAQFVARWKNA